MWPSACLPPLMLRIALLSYCLPFLAYGQSFERNELLSMADSECGLALKLARPTTQR
jgi:hypothetical protein